MWSPKIRKKIVTELFHRNKYKIAHTGEYQVDCALCKTYLDIDEATIDHKIPKSKGGTNDIKNLQLAHQVCNKVKGNYYNDNDFL